MNISSVGACSPPNALDTQQGADAKIRSLEQKLQQLNAEKEKAARRRDEDAKQKLEKQIEEMKKQIERLKRQAKCREAEPASDAPGPRETVREPSGVGKYMDVYG